MDYNLRPRIFAISDLHLYHKNILKFTMGDGTKLRPFNTLEEMHNTIIHNWWHTVRDIDHVYVVGDVTFHTDGLKILKLLPGHKRLVLGNHDKLKMAEYHTVFEKIYGVRQVNGVWLTHVPMHQGSVDNPRVKFNIHGHLHGHKIKHQKYINVSVECVNYTPLDITDFIREYNI